MRMQLFSKGGLMFIAIAVVVSAYCCQIVLAVLPLHRMKEMLETEFTSETPYLLIYPLVASAISDTNMVLHVSGILYKLDQTDFPNNFTQSVLNLPLKSNLVNQVYKHAVDEGKAEASETDIKYRLRLFRAEREDDEDVKLRVTVGNFGAMDRTDLLYGDNVIVAGGDTTQLSMTDMAVTTDSDGFFQMDIAVQLAQSAQNSTASATLTMPTSALHSCQCGLSRDFRVRVSIESSHGQQEVGTMVTAHVLESSGLSIISDVDDTTKISFITASKQTVAETGLYGKYVAVPGMSDAYNKWMAQFSPASPAASVGVGTGSNPTSLTVGARPATISFHYVSGATWTLAPPYYNQFLTKAKFPAGTLTSKNNFVGLSDSVKYPTIASSFYLPWTTGNATEKATHVEVSANSTIPNSAAEASTFVYKSVVINKLVTQAPLTRNFVLLGDSTEFDPEVYAEMVDNWGWAGQQHGDAPGRIQCIFLRAVQPVLSNESDGGSSTPRSLVRELLEDGGDDMSLTKLATEKCADGTDMMAVGSCLQRAAPQYLAEFTKRVDSLYSKWPDMRASRVRIFHDGGDLMSVNLAAGQC